MNRYEDVTEEFVESFLGVLEKFTHIHFLTYKLLFDTKKRISKGKITLASIELANEKIKFFSKDNVAVDGYDYVLIVDKKAWELASPADRERILRHELCHVFIDEKGKCKIIGHEVEDFYSELKANEDDPEWGRRLSMLVNDVYEQEKDMKKGET